MHAVRLYIHGCVSQVYIFLFWFIIYSNGAMPLLFLFRSKQHMVFCLMCSQAGRACWLCTASLLYPAPPHPHPSSSVPTPHCLSVSCRFPSGMERDSPYDLERSSDRRLLVKKPCFPQYRNRSLDCPAGTRCMYLFRLLQVCVVWQPCGGKTY